MSPTYFLDLNEMNETIELMWLSDRSNIYIITKHVKPLKHKAVCNSSWILFEVVFIFYSGSIKNIKMSYPAQAQWFVKMLRKDLDLMFWDPFFHSNNLPNHLYKVSCQPPPYNLEWKEKYEKKNTAPIFSFKGNRNQTHVD